MIVASLPSPLWDVFPNLIPNPDFEEDLDRDGIPDYWNKEVEGGGFLSSGSPAFKGKKAIFIDGKGTWRCRIKNIEPRRYYLLSLWIKRDGWRDGEYPEISIFDKTFYLDELFSWGGWLKLSWIIKSGNDRCTTLFLKSHRMSHRVWFDSLSMTEFAIQPISPVSGATVEGGTPKFEWLVPENDMILSVRLHLSQDENFRDGIIVERLSPQGNSYSAGENLPDGRWYWKAQVYKNRNEIASSDAQCFRVEGQESTGVRVLSHGLRPADAVLSKNLSPDFFPIGIYGGDIKDLPLLKGAGFNSVQTYSSDLRFLDSFILEAERYQLKAMIRIPGEAWKRDITTFFSRIRNSPGLLSWYLDDEPEGRAVPPSYIWKLNHYIHKMDPSHPTSLVLVRSKKAYDYGDGVDILMVDPYPIPQMPVTWLSDSIDEVRRATFDEKPIWAVIQAFDWSAFPAGEDKREWGRNPTYEEERCLTYLAVVHGVRGIFYYTYKGGRYNITDYPVHWEGIKRIVWELNQIYPLLLAPTPNQKIRIEMEAASPQSRRPQAIHYVVKSMDKRSSSDFRGLLREGTYIIAVNAADTPAKVSMYGSFSGNRANVLFENRVIPIEEGRLDDYFSPYQVHIYEILPGTDD